MPKVKSQNTLQSPFFKLCSGEFKQQGLTEDSSYDQYVAAAELKVKDFLNQEDVRSLPLPTMLLDFV